MSIVKCNVPVVGMACAACAANIERRLRQLDGVRDASVSLPLRMAQIEYDDDAISLAEINRERSTTAHWQGVWLGLGQ